MHRLFFILLFNIDIYLCYIIIVRPGWRNGRRAGLKIQCPCGVWVQVPPSVPCQGVVLMVARLFVAQQERGSNPPTLTTYLYH